jgi:PAS domain S-box-containing protein
LEAPTEDRDVTENKTSARPETLEAVEELLRQLVDARFVLTDREGSVTRWSRPAEKLFGWPGARMLGRPLLATLAVPDERRATGGEFRAVAQRRDGSEVEVALTVVPVRMSQSLEFNGFLEALEIAVPHGDALIRLQQSHRAVVDWIGAAVAGEARLDESELTAGTIVAFRPLVEPPTPAGHPAEGADAAADSAAVAAAGQVADAIEAALGRSEDLERAIRGTAVEAERAHREAATARGEAAEAAGRVAELADLTGRLGAELGDARRLLGEMGKHVEELRSELRESHAASEQRSRKEREQAAGAVDETRALVESLRAEVAGMPQEQARLGSELEGTRASLSTLAGELAQGVERAAGTETEIRRELSETRSLVQALNDRIDDARVAATEDEEQRQVLAELREEMTTLRELAGGGSVVDDAELRSLVQEARATAAVASDHAAEAGSAVAAAEQLAARAEQAAEAAGAASSRARDAADASEAGVGRAEEAAIEARSSSTDASEAAGSADRHARRAGEHSREAEDQVRKVAEAGAAAEPVAKRAEDAAAAAERFAESAWNAVRAALERAVEGYAAPGGPAAADRLGPNGGQPAGERADPHRPLFGRKPLDRPMREARPGFDDAANPMATIGLDGHFRDLNRAFTELVGFAEHEFHAAVWPPVTDRPNLPKHREEMSRMVAGEIDSAEVNTGYVHAQGLLVPVVGRISLVRENDEPSHFLLEVEGA